MKKLLIFAVIAGFSFWIGQNQEKFRSSWKALESKVQNIFVKRSEAPAETSTETVTAAGAPSAIQPPPQAAVTSISPDLPEGVYYTRERITEVTDAGVRSIMAGVRVKKVSNTSGKVLVDDGKLKLAADEWKLTRDPEEVAKLLQTTGK